MNLISLSIVSVIFVLICLKLKKVNPEYSTLLSIGACLLIIGYIIIKLSSVVEYISQITEYINIDIMYIEIILKMIAIAYICEFASCLCKDAGYSAIGTEIELAGRVSMVVISLPVLLSVIDIITRLVE